MKRLVDVYPYRKESNEVQFLVLKRAKNVIYADQWRMIGGKVRNKETYYEAGLRELKEETGIYPDLFWTLPSINQFYDHHKDAIMQIPAFGALANNPDNISLNHEHVDWNWISEKSIDTYIQWPEQKRLMHLLADIVTENQIIDEWKIEF